MKRLFTFLLLLAMLVSICMVATAETAEEKPFYFMNIAEADESLTSIYHLSFAYTGYASVQKGDAAWVSLYGTKDIPTLAQRLKENYDQRPEGTRYMRFDLPQVAFHVHAEDVIYVDKSVEYMLGWMEAFFSAYHAIGGKIDGLVVDIEFEDLYATYIHSRYAVNDPLIYDKIVKNPIYQTKIRPELEARGFKFYPNVTEQTPEIYGIHPNAGDEYSLCDNIWDTVVRNYINQSVTEACRSFMKYYPNGVVTDYQSKNTLSWLKELDDGGGAVVGDGGNFVKAGNSNCDNTYSVRLGTNFYVDYYTKEPAYTQIPGYNHAIVDETPFVMFQHDMNIFKNTYLASENGNTSFWFGHYRYNLESKNSVSMTPYYTETLIHTALLDPQVLLGYVVPGELEKPEYYETAMQIVDDTMKELTRVVGYANRKPIDVATDWNSKFVLSGMYANGSNYYRITPDTNVVSLEDFMIQGSDPTFRVNGETVTFPGGEIIADGAITEIGTCGYWVRTAADVKPVVIRDADYWKVYPAYQESYEDYAVGIEYNYNNALPVACWQVKKSKDASALIQTDPLNADNQLLAIKGTYTAKNMHMPENVTAGDSYAEHQAWEVSVQIPADMSAEAEVVLLNAVGNSNKKAQDKGVKIAGGKLYYDNAGEYVEMPRLKVEANTWYTIVREMYFVDAGSYTSSYRVYDSTGKLVANTENVPVSELELPVMEIGLSCSDVTGEAVLLDNYKLYPTRVGYDFELYNADTGIRYTDITTPTSTDTAYRFSWLNTTQKEKSYSIVAAYYNGDTLVSEEVIQEVKMAPNEDGIAYGVVEKVEGQTMNIYLNDNNPDEEEEEKPPVNEIKPGSDYTIMILIIAVTLLIAAGVVALLLVRKKKKLTQNK